MGVDIGSQMFKLCTFQFVCAVRESEVFRRLIFTTHEKGSAYSACFVPLVGDGSSTETAEQQQLDLQMIFTYHLSQDMEDRGQCGTVKLSIKLSWIC